MHKTKIKKCLLYIVPGILVYLFALTAFSSQKGVGNIIRKATVKIDKESQVENAVPIPRNIVKSSMDYQGGEFFTEKRKDEIRRYRCSSCHNNKTVSIQNAAKISHADINVIHGGIDNPLDCNICHSKDNRDFLVSNKGGNIDLDHVYEKCGECHFRQKKDWVGGAHGKRITYWAGERVVKNCTSCHDPHSPRFVRRWPSTYSVPLK